MKVVKKYIKAIIAIVILIGIIVAIIFVKDMFTTETKAIYGTRTEGISKVKISDETINKVKDSLKEANQDVSVRVQGRIVYVSITAKDDTGLDAAKGFAPTALGCFSDAEKQYYDFQFLIKKNNDSKQFPIIGYKHRTRENISWTKDRAEN